MLNTKRKKRLLWQVIITSITLSIILAGLAIYTLYAPNIHLTGEDTYLYIKKDAVLDDLITQLEKKTDIKNTHTLLWVAEKMQYDRLIKPGRYKIDDRSSNLSLIRKLRSGNQDPMLLRFHNIRTKEQLAGKIAGQIMADSLTIIRLLNDTAFLNQYDVNLNTAVSLFIPNTYEVFWDMNAEDLFDRMKREYQNFWNTERKEKAAAIPLTPVEVMTLASIVEEETNKKQEYPIIAGLYINRLKRRMPLQACPTVKYAMGNFTLQRILKQHLETISPYNTYIHPGLPPGPIRLPSTPSIDAVLNYERHNYLYMTAKETFNGEHNFASSLREHNRNARKYQIELNKLGIK